LEEGAFETFTDILASENEHLEEGSSLTAQMALNTARLSKGMVTLTDNFKDNVKTLTNANRSSYEYAEAIASLKDGFEEMFGYKPSTVFIESHLEDIEKLASGDYEALENLRDGLAEDYVYNLEIATAYDFDASMSREEI
jgi:hypothetical protein